MNKGKDDYKEVFKSTLLFAFVRAVQMLIGILRNKLVALILGPAGIGLIQIYDKTTELIKKGAGLGISQSALRDISVARNSDDSSMFSQVYTATRRVILFTGLLGVLVTVALSKQLSIWTCGDTEHTIAYISLALVVFFTIITEVQMSILKGVRAQKQLAYSTIIGSLSGLVFSVPIYYFFKEDGIVPALIIHAFVSFGVTFYFVKKISYIPEAQSFHTTCRIVSPMIKVGVILVFVGMLDSLFAVLLASFLRRQGGFDTVGFYQAGHTIMSSYFGIVLTSMVMDYYPRVSAINYDNIKVADEFNKQAKIGLLFIFPLSVIFVFFAPFIIRILYSNQFLCVVEFSDFAIIGAILAVIAECLRIILVAKQIAKTYAIISLILKGAFIPMYIFFFNIIGLRGLGISYMLDNFIQVLVYSFLMNSRYKITLDKESALLLASCVMTTIIMKIVRDIQISWISYSLGLSLILLVVFTTNKLFIRYIGKSLLQIGISKIKKH